MIISAQGRPACRSAGTGHATPDQAEILLPRISTSEPRNWRRMVVLSVQSNTTRVHWVSTTARRRFAARRFGVSTIPGAYSNAIINRFDVSRKSCCYSRCMMYFDMESTPDTNKLVETPDDAPKAPTTLLLKCICRPRDVQLAWREAASSSLHLDERTRMLCRTSTCFVLVRIEGR